MYLLKALQCMAIVILRLQRLKDEEGTEDPYEGEKIAHTQQRKPGTRVTTMKPSGLSSYKTCLAATTDRWKGKSMCLWVTSQRRKTERVVCDGKSQPSTPARLHSSFEREERYQSFVTYAP